MLLDDLGKRIRAMREKRGLKQADIANALSVSPQAVSKWERGENGPDLAVLGPLARLLGVSTDWILGANEEDLDVFEATVFVSSVYGAYEKSLRMEPRDFTSWANGYFSQLTEAVLRHDAVPIKYMGDKFLCFFSGIEHQRRALEAARLAKGMVNEALKIGLSSGEIFLGSVGYGDYANLDIMGQVVNIAFITMDWAEEKTESGIGAETRVTSGLEDRFAVGQSQEINFRGIDHPVKVCEVLIPS